jgi:hypothetical protein
LKHSDAIDSVCPRERERERERVRAAVIVLPHSHGWDGARERGIEGVRDREHSCSYKDTCDA